MTSIAPRDPAAAPLPDRSVVPPVWGRITNLVVDHGEGSLAGHAGRATDTSTTRPGSA